MPAGCGIAVAIGIDVATGIAVDCGTGEAGACANAGPNGRRTKASTPAISGDAGNRADRSMTPTSP
jgi:hypothetical protein